MRAVKETHGRKITILMVVMGVIMAYLICAMAVQQKPYLRTDLSFTMRYLILFPLFSSQKFKTGELSNAIR